MACSPIGQDSVNLAFKGPDGPLHERMLFRSDEAPITIAVEGRRWGLDGKAEDFKIGAEAYRIHLAHLCDPLMAIHTDDPGAGKTIMAGLLIRELRSR